MSVFSNSSNTKLNINIGKVKNIILINKDPRNRGPKNGGAKNGGSIGLRNKCSIIKRLKTYMSILTGNEKGAFTVESSIVFPIMIIITVLTIITTTLFFYDLMAASKYRSLAAACGEYVLDPFGDPQSGLISYNTLLSIPLYSDIAGFFRQDETDKKTLLHIFDSSEITKNAVVKSLDVEFPRTFYGKKDHFTYSKNDPASVVRNVDLISDGIASSIDFIKGLKG